MIGPTHQELEALVQPLLPPGETLDNTTPAVWWYHAADALYRELGALQKAHDLLNKGFESACELMNELKQENRKLKGGKQA